MNVRSSKLIKFAKHAYQTASQSIPEYSSKYSRKDYTQWQHVALLCIKERTRQKWEEFPDLLENMPYELVIIEARMQKFQGETSAKEKKYPWDLPPLFFYNLLRLPDPV